MSARTPSSSRPDPALAGRTLGTTTAADDVDVVVVVAEAPQPRHAVGCPEERLETYPARRPDGREVTITRCIDCGEQILYEHQELSYG